MTKRSLGRLKLIVRQDFLKILCASAKTKHTARKIIVCVFCQNSENPTRALTQNIQSILNGLIYAFYPIKNTPLPSSSGSNGHLRNRSDWIWILWHVISKSPGEYRLSPKFPALKRVDKYQKVINISIPNLAN